MLIQANHSVLLIIDIQGNLAQVIDQGAAAIARVQWLAEIATELQIPKVITEQYPRGLGHTVTELQALAQTATVVEKSHFSAMQEPHFADALAQLKRRQVVLCGMETHVCVLQTAVELQAAGYQVFIVEDGCGSRRSSDKQVALQRLGQLGIHRVTSEMVAFEWLHDSATAQFKQISKNWLRKL